MENKKAATKPILVKGRIKLASPCIKAFVSNQTTA
jgi:hypothetical protein